MIIHRLLTQVCQIHDSLGSVDLLSLPGSLWVHRQDGTGLDLGQKYKSFIKFSPFKMNLFNNLKLR